MAAPPDVVAYPRTGYKLVDYDTWQGLQGTEVYTVGSTHALPDGQDVVLCTSGYHYCARAVDCLVYVPCEYRRRRLLEVSVPADAVIRGDGHKFAASKLTVEREIDLPSALLTGTTTMTDGVGHAITFWFLDGKGHDGPNGEPAESIRRREDSRNEWLDTDGGRPNLTYQRLDGTLSAAYWPPRDTASPPWHQVWYASDGVTITSESDYCDAPWTGHGWSTTYRDGKKTHTSVSSLFSRMLDSPDRTVPSKTIYANDGSVFQMQWHKAGKLVAETTNGVQ
jgi:hypothetical protein